MLRHESTLKVLVVRCATVAVAGLAVGGCGVSDDPLPQVKNPPAKVTTTKGQAGSARAQLPVLPGGGGKHKGKHGKHGGNNGGGGGGGGGGNQGGNGGGGGNQGGAAPAPKKPIGARTTRRISADPSGKLQFNVTDLWAPPGRVTITLTNPSSVTHAIAVAGANGVTRESKKIGKGGKASITVDLGAGDYEFYCPVDGHREAGMSGILSVGNLPPSVR